VPVLIGTSGWQYKDWRGPFYPPDLPQARWLEYYAERFCVQEVNNAFYRLPEASTFAARAVLERRGAAFCLADSPRRQTPVWRTADWGYLRLHEGTGSPHPCYTPAALDRWAAQLADLHGPDAEVFVFFNNDPKGCAVRDAVRFAGACRAHGLEPSRVPEPLRVSST